jgi:hypothetical protein
MYKPNIKANSSEIQVQWCNIHYNLRGCIVGITDGRVFTKYAITIVSVAITYTQRFTKTDSGIQKLFREVINIQIYIEKGAISLLIILK